MVRVAIDIFDLHIVDEAVLLGPGTVCADEDIVDHGSFQL